jgi:hypothetical protein
MWNIKNIEIECHRGWEGMGKGMLMGTKLQLDGGKKFWGAIA